MTAADRAVYGDNFFKRSQFTLRASLMAEGTERDDVAATEREIIDKRADLLAFEREFKRTRQEFETVRSESALGRRAAAGRRGAASACEPASQLWGRCVMSQVFVAPTSRVF